MLSYLTTEFVSYFIGGVRTRLARCRSFSRSVGLETNRLWLSSKVRPGRSGLLTAKLVRHQTVIVRCAATPNSNPDRACSKVEGTRGGRLGNGEGAH